MPAGSGDGSGDGFPRGHQEHRRAQVRMGLRLTHAERLRWLEESMATLRRWQGRARQAVPAIPPPPRGRR